MHYFYNIRRSFCDAKYKCNTHQKYYSGRHASNLVVYIGLPQYYTLPRKTNTLILFHSPPVKWSVTFAHRYYKAVSSFVQEGYDFVSTPLVVMVGAYCRLGYITFTVWICILLVFLYEALRCIVISYFAMFVTNICGEVFCILKGRRFI